MAESGWMKLPAPGVVSATQRPSNTAVGKFPRVGSRSVRTVLSDTSVATGASEATPVPCL
jgi:hypothetical protein